VVTLAELKKTNRERDYAVIGELARLIDDPADCLLLSRSARDLIALAKQYPELIQAAAVRRPVLRHVHDERADLEVALDAERRELIHANERRLDSYMKAAADWVNAWPEVSAEIASLPLKEAHAILVARAENLLPLGVEAMP
jgi:hypothetical protein